MKKSLKDILYKVSIIGMAGPPDQNISKIEIDSRKVKKNYLFVALSGTNSNGHDYIDESINNGASAIVCLEFPNNLKKSKTYIKVEDTTKALAVISGNFYDHPSKKLKLVGVTGTNGKTTITNLLFELFNNQKRKAGLISTINIKYDTNEIPSNHTTPDIITTNFYLSEMVSENINYCFMEVSSHGISQGRIDGLNFSGAVFSNLTHDHLDYHKTFKNYRNVKKTFFDKLPKSSFSLVNNDDKNASFMLQNTSSNKLGYAMNNFADFKVKILECEFDGMLIRINNQEVWTSLLGNFNASNLLAVFSVAALLNIPESEILRSISMLKNVPGRFQTFQFNKKGLVIIDYAHTPNALENVIDTINQIRTKNENLITVIGCGGNRDKKKRPEMGRIASQKSDKVIFTSDNPRNEDPSKIIDQMLEGVKPEDYHKVLNIEEREMAIKTSKHISNHSDIILIAGKGHESYQEICNNKIPFDDFVIAKKYFKN
jgi:UDP-N-acetylmuramoyl-L-alanyl-D-glutamate--2,6-diaminopimelate ligase